MGGGKIIDVNLWIFFTIAIKKNNNCKTKKTSFGVNN